MKTGWAIRFALAAMISGAGGAFAAAPDAATVHVPAGSYVPFYARDSVRTSTSSEPSHLPVPVPAFSIDRYPVTNRQFLEFVRAHPEWRKSQVKRIFADPQYLTHWQSDLALMSEADGDRPVTNVSWFAAEAYCRAQGKRLPTTDEWEYALADSGRDAGALKTRILAWYGETATHALPAVKTAAANSYGVAGLVGLVWEWTLDFNSLMSGSDLRGSGQQFCGGGSIGAADPSDYASFMRYSMRASLKASYTTKLMGFRCAKDESQ